MQDNYFWKVAQDNPVSDAVLDLFLKNLQSQKDLVPSSQVTLNEPVWLINIRE